MRSLLLVVKDDVSVDGGIFERLAQFRPPVVEDDGVIDGRISERLAQFDSSIVEDDGVVGRGISKRLVFLIIEDDKIIDGGKFEG